MATTGRRYRLGDIVRLAYGTLTGIEGVIVEVKRSRRVVLSVTLLQRSIQVEVAPNWLELLQPREAVIDAQVRVVVGPISAEAIYRLAEQPNKLYELEPRQFEYLIAELLEDAGYEVKITPATRDGGRDILAVLKIPYGEVLTVVDCKRFAAHRRIGPDLVERLLWVADRHDRASHAMLATTSSFTRGARKIEREYQWRLRLQDFRDLRDWLSRFGKWRRRSGGNLWQPD